MIHDFFYVKIFYLFLTPCHAGKPYRAGTTKRKTKDPTQRLQSQSQIRRLNFDLALPSSQSVHTQDGNPICHARGCRKRASSLRAAHRGFFCNLHKRMLSEIRQELQRAKDCGDIHAEALARQREIEFRKQADAGHMWWQLKIEESFTL